MNGETAVGQAVVRTARKRRSGLADFWAQYRRRPYGLVGLAMLVVYIAVALAAPLLTPYDPRKTQFLADRLAAPTWARFVIPRFRNAPPTERFTIRAREWKVEVQERASISSQDIEGQGETMVIGFDPSAGGESAGRCELAWPVRYRFNPPNTFEGTVTYRVEAPADSVTMLSFIIVDPDGKEYDVWGTTVYGEQDWSSASLDSRDLQMKTRLNMTIFDDPAKVVFSTEGDYRLVLRASSESPSGEARLFIAPTGFNILGILHGILGADHMGSDLWAQLVYGARISLIIGISAAVIGVALGTAIGIISGYLGGTVDEFLMRVADVFLSVPTLPVLIILSAFLGKNMWNIVLLVAAFAWMGSSRVVRSQTLSLKERAFVEAARAAGASDAYIMVTHILPNVLPLVVANMVLMMPVAILYEASLSFLGLGDPRIATWGRMLQNARAFGAFTAFAWWWLIPPGLAITCLSLAFTFIGNTVNEVLNPRYRERS
ncbi:MAG: ABC transporter permease [Bacillota bacterium]